MEAKYRSWGLSDLIIWKMLPKVLGGGYPYLYNYKDGWVVYNREKIKLTAAEFAIPDFLLAGTAWIEVGGDPYFLNRDLIDEAAFYVRSFDWIGPDVIDKLAMTKNPLKTSFGTISIQLETAAKTMGIDLRKFSFSEQKSLIADLESDVFNLRIVAKHLKDIIMHYYSGTFSHNLSDLQIKIIGAAYNRGMKTMGELYQNSSYGDFIIKIKERLMRLLNNYH